MFSGNGIAKAMPFLYFASHSVKTREGFPQGHKKCQSAVLDIPLACPAHGRTPSFSYFCLQQGICQLAESEISLSFSSIDSSIIWNKIYEGNFIFHYSCSYIWDRRSYSAMGNIPLENKQLSCQFFRKLHFLKYPVRRLPITAKKTAGIPSVIRIPAVFISLKAAFCGCFFHCK